VVDSNGGGVTAGHQSDMAGVRRELSFQRLGSGEFFGRPDLGAMRGEGTSSADRYHEHSSHLQGARARPTAEGGCDGGPGTFGNLPRNRVYGPASAT